MPQFNLSFFLVGCLGGLLPDVLRLIKARFGKDVLAYMKTFKYWAGLILLAAVGGLVAWLFNVQEVQSAIAYGFAAPEIIEKLAADKSQQDSAKRHAIQKSPQTAEELEKKFQLRSWWGY